MTLTIGVRLREMAFYLDHRNLSYEVYNSFFDFMWQSRMLPGPLLHQALPNVGPEAIVTGFSGKVVSAWYFGGLGHVRRCPVDGGPTKNSLYHWCAHDRNRHRHLST